MTVTFQRVTKVRAPRERVFELSLRTDLHEGSMSQYRERGPFAAFRHEHTFEEDDGVTVMTDRVELRAPGGPVGRIAERLLLGRYIERLIDERNSFLAAQAEGGP